MSRAALYIATLLVAIAVVAYVAGPWGSSDEAPSAGDQQDSRPAGNFQPAAAGQVPVTVAEARRGDLVMRITANGVAEADRLLRIAAQVGGTIEHIAVREGQFVAAGELLVALDETELRMDRDQAEAALLQSVMSFAERMMTIPGDASAGDEVLSAQSTTSALDFLRELVSPQAYRTLQSQPALEARLREFSREDLSSAQSDLSMRQVVLEKAELDLQRARITAPFGGQVTGLEASAGPNVKAWPVVGQRVSAGTDLMLLVAADPIRLRVEVIESEIGQIREGRRAEVTFQAYPDEVFEGTIEAISPVVDSERRSLSVSVALPNPDYRLKPGMSANVVLDTEIFTDRLLVPSTAVVYRDERPLVFAVVDGRAKWVYIDMGLQNPDWVEVLGAAAGNLEIAEGTVVITSGHFTMAHDTPVQITGEQ